MHIYIYIYIYAVFCASNHLGSFAATTVAPIHTRMRACACVHVLSVYVDIHIHAYKLAIFCVHAFALESACACTFTHACIYVCMPCAPKCWNSCAFPGTSSSLVFTKALPISAIESGVNEDVGSSARVRICMYLYKHTPGIGYEHEVV